MNAVSLNRDGTIRHKQSAVDSEILQFLGFQIELEKNYTLRSFFKMIDKYGLLGKLNWFFPAYIEQYQGCPDRGCHSGLIDHLEFFKTVEMIGYPQKCLEIYCSIRGVLETEPVEIRSLQLNSLLDIPLMLGKLKHVVFGDRVDIFEFDTVFSLFEFIDGITWELSFHVAPEQCELRRWVMFTKILFATTASPTCDNAAKVAFDLEMKWEANLTVFHVLGIPTRGYSPFVTDVRTGEVEQPDPDYIEWVREEMKNTYGELLKDSENVEIKAAVGIPAREILRMARKEDVDLIIMGAHTRQEDIGATRYRSVVGSTMQKVAKSARCPVVIISRPCTTCWKLFSNIVFGTDFSKASYSAFLFAAKLAKEVGAKLHIFHTCDIASSSAGQVLRQEEIEQLIEGAHQRMEKRYGAKMNGYDNYDIEVREGILYVEILKFAREKQGDLIVMAHHTREIDPEEAVLGSTVEQVVLRSACPVASVNHPDKVA